MKSMNLLGDTMEVELLRLKDKMTHFFAVFELKVIDLHCMFSMRSFKKLPLTSYLMSSHQNNNTNNLHNSKIKRSG